MSFEDVVRQIIRDEMKKIASELQNKKELPPFLNRTEMMELLRIGPTKASELMNRPDFPVCREAGLLIPTDMLFEWIRRNTRWVESNTDYFKQAIS
ncbi:DNA-binding protein [Lederbergia lenta]|uniref:DNA-binding protein n=1 Tax=Lederbergia lenta TaxID=1467 RepID=UPI0020416887|nr:DNA-binding protein [Lederbergia lenta]MCM3110643.1 DNA-binding protein [Lederbergia lenta]